MHTLIDLCSLLLTTAFVVGTVLVIALLMHKCGAAIDATKSSLEKRGWKVSSSGMSVPPGKRALLLDRERYLDATQRGLSKAANASTFGGSLRMAEQDPLSRDQAPAGQRSGIATGSSASADADADADVSGSGHKHHRPHLFKLKRHVD